MVGDFSLNVANALTAGLLHQHIRAGTAHRLLRPECRTVGRPAAICTAPLVRNLPCINTCPCSIWSIVCSVPFCRTAKTFGDCGRPCETRQVKLRDRGGYRAYPPGRCRMQKYGLPTGWPKPGPSLPSGSFRPEPGTFAWNFCMSQPRPGNPDHPLTISSY